MEQKNKNIWQPLIFAGLLAVGVVTGYFLRPGGGGGIFGSGSKFDNVLNLIEGRYVDTVNEKDLTEAAITEMLHNLDPHSSYLPPEETKAADEQLNGNFEGIGVEFNILNDTIFVVSAIPGGPSEQLGILAGDRIVQVDGENVAGIKITNEMVIKRLKGQKGTKVKVGIKRIGVNEILQYTITRDVIPIYSVEAAYMVDKTTGYIKLSRFSSETYDEVSDAMKRLMAGGMQNLVFDLRGNPGGYLEMARKVSNEFLADNKMIVYTEGVHQSRRDYPTTHNGRFTEGKLVVLIDEGSASASEIVSGAIQDWDRGIIVGRRSFGKGLVQEPFKLSDGSTIRLTVARYYTPTGRSIQKSYADGYEVYEHEVSKRIGEGELDVADSIKRNEKLEYKTPRGRKVYGGGGIYPDVFVPLDSALHTELVTQIYRNGLLSRYVYRYMDDNSKTLKIYKDVKDFDNRFDVSAGMMSDFRSLMVTAKIGINESEYAQAEHLMKAQIKALIARQLFGKEAYYEVLNKTDRTFNEGLKALNSYEAYLR